MASAAFAVLAGLVFVRECAAARRFRGLRRFLPFEWRELSYWAFVALLVATTGAALAVAGLVIARKRRRGWLVLALGVHVALIVAALVVHRVARGRWTL